MTQNELTEFDRIALTVVVIWVMLIFMLPEVMIPLSFLIWFTVVYNGKR